MQNDQNSLVAAIKRFVLFLGASFFLATAAYSLEDPTAEDLEVIEMLDLLERYELLDDEDFELLETVTEIGESDDN